VLDTAEGIDYQSLRLVRPVAEQPERVVEVIGVGPSLAADLVLAVRTEAVLLLGGGSGPGFSQTAACARPQPLSAPARTRR
jgi:hypothetical protein